MCVWEGGDVTCHLNVCDFAAGSNEAEGDGGVGSVCEQLERQTLEEQEDGEEGKSFTTAIVSVIICTVQL